MDELSTLPTTDSGHVKKKHAMRWLDGLNEPSGADLKKAVVPKPNGFSGSKYATEISAVRVTGDPQFIEAVAGLLKPLRDLEDESTRLELNLQQTEDRETEELTDNYALYLSVAERG
jgi:hypothetical protein